MKPRVQAIKNRSSWGLVLRDHRGEVVGAVGASDLPRAVYLLSGALIDWLRGKKRGGRHE